MKKLLVLFLTTIIFTIPTQAEVIKTGVSIEHIPNALFGSWRVNAKLDTTNSLETFKPQSIDIWNMTRVGDKITLQNPLSGAKADISVQTVQGNLIVFSKKLPYDNKILTDTITIRLKDNEFSGINTLTLESFSLIDNHLMKTETALYNITGEKIYGESVIVE